MDRYFSVTIRLSYNPQPPHAYIYPKVILSLVLLNPHPYSTLYSCQIAGVARYCLYD
jgi:hypothetical protein